MIPECYLMHYPVVYYIPHVMSVFMPCIDMYECCVGWLLNKTLVLLQLGHVYNLMILNLYGTSVELGFCPLVHCTKCSVSCAHLVTANYYEYCMSSLVRTHQIRRRSVKRLISVLYSVIILINDREWSADVCDVRVCSQAVYLVQ